MNVTDARAVYFTFVHARRRLRRSVAVCCGALALLVVPPVSLADAATTIASTQATQVIGAGLNSGKLATVNSVSCVSTTFCVAGGSYVALNPNGGSQGFVSLFNGSSWTDRSLTANESMTGMVQLSSSAVFSVSCVSTSFCVAGGTFFDTTGVEEPFVATYSGSTWTFSSLGQGGQGGSVQDVSCASSTFCVAVGEGPIVNGAPADVWTFNGASWTPTSVGAELGSSANLQLNLVKCLSSSFCVVAGRYVDGATLELYASVLQGGRWVGSSFAETTNVGSLSSLACVTTTFCVIGGQTVSDVAAAGGSAGMVATFNGKSWHVTDLTSALYLSEGFAEGYISSVSCPTVTFCMASGFYNDIDGSSNALVAQFNGATWTTTELAAELNQGYNAYAEVVNCPSTSSCVVGGYYGDGNLQTQLTQGNWHAFMSTYARGVWTDHGLWDGLASGYPPQVPAPAEPTYNVAAIACPAISMCVIGGSYRYASWNTNAMVTRVSFALNVDDTYRFPVNSATVSPAGLSALRTLASEIAEYGTKVVRVVGHSSKADNATLRIRLSLQRATAVAAALRSDLTALGDRTVTITAQGAGVSTVYGTVALNQNVIVS